MISHINYIRNHMISYLHNTNIYQLDESYYDDMYPLTYVI